ncbi:unnamed protein product, partial [Mesorhabditis spiculigera]
MEFSCILFFYILLPAITATRQCWADTSYSKTNVHTGNQAKLTCAGDFCAKFVYPTGTEWGCPAPGVCTKGGKQKDYTGPIDATGKRATGTMYCCDRELCNSAGSFDAIAFSIKCWSDQTSELQETHTAAKKLVDCPSMSFCGKLVYEGGVEWGCIEKEAYCVDSKSQLLTIGDEHKIECMTDFCAKSILANSMENIAAWDCGTMLLWAVSFMIPSFTDVELDRPFKTYIYSLNLNHALLAAVSVMVGYDQRGKHLGFGELFERGSANFNLASALIMLIIDCVWMHLYAWTVDQSRKAEGTKWFKEWMKEMRGHYHLEGEQVKPEVRKGLVDEVDQVRSSKVADIEVESLTKKYGLTGGYGLIDMNLRATRGQVTVLLGHNGAGKSTAFNVICGKTKPTFGTVHVEGPIGLCPQTNPLFAKLSALEHLWFFHHLKGSSGDWEDEAERLMHDLDFYDAKDELAQNLSGGTKRKLCVAMAVIGDPNVILLDEPTAGMDPGARIAVEKLLQRVKKDRTILLTTHFMDEAEKVGDWVTIIQSGRNILNGSPEYLKKKYGTGYILTVVGSPVVAGVIQDTTARVDYQALEKFGQNIAEVCHKICGGDIADYPVGVARGRQIDVTIPVEHKTKFPVLMNLLENMMQKQPDPNLPVALLDFGLSMNTLEQVFLKVTDGNSTDRSSGVAAMTESWVKARKLDGSALHWAQFLAMLRKRFLHNYRNWGLLLAQLVLPTLCLLLCLRNVKEAAVPREMTDVYIPYDFSDMLYPARVILQDTARGGSPGSSFYNEKFKTMETEFISVAAHDSFDTAVLKMLVAVGMAKDANRRLRQYSGGQKRKISIGIALLAQNTIRILDEPTAGLDPRARREIWSYLDLARHRGAGGRTAQLLTSHSMDEYSGGYKLTLVLRGGDVGELTADQLEERTKQRIENVCRAVTDTFPEAKIHEIGHSLTGVWVVPATNLPWSNIWADVLALVQEGRGLGA